MVRQALSFPSGYLDKHVATGLTTVEAAIVWEGRRKRSCENFVGMQLY